MEISVIFSKPPSGYSVEKKYEWETSSEVIAIIVLIDDGRSQVVVKRM